MLLVFPGVGGRRCRVLGRSGRPDWAGRGVLNQMSASGEAEAEAMVAELLVDHIQP
ncbi:MAG TPA: hypothetical protein VLG91_12230 [Streptomyces sp.]|nr:hypothetical protein [Streptomyces sp.]